MGSYIDTAGRKKVEVLKEEIERINPEAEVVTIDSRIRVEELEGYLKDSDVLVASAAALPSDIRFISLCLIYVFPDVISVSKRRIIGRPCPIPPWRLC